MIEKSIYNTNSFTNQFIKECIYKNQIESNHRKRIFLTPHAEIQESQNCATLTLQYLPENPNKILIIATNHGYIPNENIEIKEENDIKNFLEKEHSARINTEIIVKLRENFQSNNFIYRVYSKEKSSEETNTILTELKNFLNENLNNVIVFTTDLSHEENISTSEVLEKEHSLLNYIFLNKITNENQQTIPKEIKSISACGGYNLYLFLRLCKKLNQYTEIMDYNNSQNMKDYWTSKKFNRIVSYLGLSNNNNIENTFIKNTQFYLKFLCSYSRSILLEEVENGKEDITFPNFDFNIENPIFITIEKEIFPEVGKSFLLNRFQDKVDTDVLGCIGNLSSQNLKKKVKSISYKLIHDNKTRWKTILTPEIIKSKNFKIYISVLEKISDWKKIEIPIEDKTIGYAIGEKNKNNNENEINYSGIFLPSVWAEDNPSWTVEQYINHLKKKGGIYRNSNYNIFLFRSISFENEKFLNKKEECILKLILHINKFQSIINNIKKNKTSIQESKLYEKNPYLSFS